MLQPLPGPLAGAAPGAAAGAEINDERFTRRERAALLRGGPAARASRIIYNAEARPAAHPDAVPDAVPACLASSALASRQPPGRLQAAIRASRWRPACPCS